MRRDEIAAMQILLLVHGHHLKQVIMRILTRGIMRYFHGHLVNMSRAVGTSHGHLTHQKTQVSGISPHHPIFFDGFVLLQF